MLGQKFECSERFVEEFASELLEVAVVVRAQPARRQERVAAASHAVDSVARVVEGPVGAEGKRCADMPGSD